MNGIDVKVLERYDSICRLENSTDNDGERQAAIAARKRLEEKHPHLSLAHQEWLAMREYAEGDPNGSFYSSGEAWNWNRMAEMAGDFFSNMRQYTEFAFGLNYARILAQRATVQFRNNPTGSMSLIFRAEASDLDSLEGMSDEQKQAYIDAVSNRFHGELTTFVEKYL